MTDTRTNEQIVTESLMDRYGLTWSGEAIVAALAAAGRLVTPEHDAEVWDEGRTSFGMDLLSPLDEIGRRRSTPNPYRTGEQS